MSATSGKIEPLMLFKVFRSMLDRRMSGVLTVQRGQVMKKARFAAGQAVQVASNRPEERLAPALVDEGLISSTEMVEIDEARRTDRRTFEALVRERGLVSPERLDTIERRMARRRLLEAFGWPDGSFAFEPAAVRPGATPVVDTVELLVEAGARMVPPAVAERFLAGYPGQQIRLTEWATTYGAAYDAAFPGQNLRALLVRPVAASGIGALPGDRARHICEAATLVLSGLGTLERIEGQARAGGPATASGPQRAPAAASGPQRAPVSGAQRVAHPATARAGAPTAAESTGGGAGAVAVGSPPPPPPPGPMRWPVRSVPPGPAAVAPHPTRSDPPAARRSPSSSSGGPSTPPAAARPVRMRGTPASAAAPASAPPLPEKIRAKLAEASELAATADKKTHYELLGVPKNADENTIRNAFRKLARDFHADRFARYGLDKDAQSAVQKVFIAINRAHETLSDPARRTEYDLGLEMRVAGGGRPGAPGGAPQVDQVFKAEKLVKDATILISRGEAEPAIERLKQALAVVPEDAVAKAALAFAEHLVAQSQGGSQVVLRRALEAVETLCRDLDNREEPFLYLGRLYRAVGEQDKAIKAFEQALRINPHYAEAGSELRHAQRKVEQTKSSSGLAGLFGRRKK